MRNYLTIAGKDSRDFGVYISGQGTFSAPEKAYEFYSVPGRNGAILGNENRLENIEVSYECFIYTNFDQNIAEFRTFLLSLNGYQRLTDSYHSDEFRMAVYVGPFEPEVTAKNDAGAFTLTFNCKPQRWLVSGETKYSWIPGSEQQLGGYSITAYYQRLDHNLFRGIMSMHVNNSGGYTTKTYKRITHDPQQTRLLVDGMIKANGSELVQSGSTGIIFDYAHGEKTYTSWVRMLPLTGWSQLTNTAGTKVVFKNSQMTVLKDRIYCCTHYRADSATDQTSDQQAVDRMAIVDYGILIRGTDYFVSDKDFSTVTQFETWLNEQYNAGTALQVDGDYANPNTISFTPYFPAESDILHTPDYITITSDNPYVYFQMRYTSGDDMSNPTLFPASPLLRVYGTGTFTMDGCEIAITDCTEYVDIDCELMDCYEGSVNRNNDVTFSTYDFPKLRPGDNIISDITGITLIEITPRWWRV